MKTWKNLVLFGLALAFILGTSVPGRADGKIMVYSPWKDEIMQKFGEMFQKETGIKLESINISTGEIHARVKGEKARPQAVIWHSVRAELLDKAKEEGLIAPYKPANAKFLLPIYAYPEKPAFTGTTMYPLVMPARGFIQYGDLREELRPDSCVGSLDWGRGVWEYQSYWNWASSSGFIPDGRTIGLNLGRGFGDLSKAGENAVILNNRLHKLEQVKFDYVSGDYMQPWKFTDSAGRLDLLFTPFKERLAKTNLGVITSHVHQMFGRYRGTVTSNEGEQLQIADLVGFAEEHHARW